MKDNDLLSNHPMSDSVVAIVWDKLVDDGWTPPRKPTDAISTVVKLLQLDKGPDGFKWIDKLVQVRGEDFVYEARCLCSFPKKNGKVRYIVEDNGRIFVQREDQLTWVKE